MHDSSQVFEALDYPNEWFFNATTQQLYLIPNATVYVRAVSGLCPRRAVSVCCVRAVSVLCPCAVSAPCCVRAVLCPCAV